MKKYVMLLLLLTGCKEFHYDDKVRVVSGFYTGCIGFVEREDSTAYLINSHYCSERLFFNSWEIEKVEE